MVKKIILVLAAFSALSWSTLGYSQNVAVVNIQAAILDSDFGRAELKKLEDSSEYSTLVAEAQTLVADIQALDKDAQANRSKWVQDQKADYNKQRQFLTADLQLNNQKRQAEQQQAVQLINQTMNEKASVALKSLIEEEKITLLLKDTAIYHATDAHDITAKLAAKLNKS